MEGQVPFQSQRMNTRYNRIKCVCVRARARERVRACGM